MDRPLPEQTFHPPFVPPAPFKQAAALLLEALRCTADLGGDPWDFAVEVDELRAAGLTNSALRWLLRKGYVRHATEVAGPAAPRRTFHPAGDLILTPTACFLLTEAGLPFALALAARPADVPAPPASPRGVIHLPATPTWDSDRQELRLGGLVVKCFKVPAPNQEVVLAAFQEERWPVRIDDPLPPLPGQDPKRRLHETITSLNRNQKRPLISFHGDGSGEGVRWEAAAAPAG